MPFSSKFFDIRAGARASPLSRIQVTEVLVELKNHHPAVDFDVTFLNTSGDIDQKTSLRMLEKTNFFTKEIDEALLNDHCRIGIHSAKDLPSPLPRGLKLICLTKGVNPSDSLVLRPGSNLENLPPHARIATSSIRREECVRQLRDDLTFVDMRGTIGQRLEKLDNFEADGIVIAEAALIRLGLTHLNRITLPGPPAEGQGQLAIIGKDDDDEMDRLFTCMDIRK